MRNAPDSIQESFSVAMGSSGDASEVEAGEDSNTLNGEPVGQVSTSFFAASLSSGGVAVSSSLKIKCRHFYQLSSLDFYKFV